MAVDAENRYNVPNLERALTILEYLVQHTEGCGISAIAENLGFPKNSVFRILKTLLAHGYVTESENQYQVTTKLLALGYEALGESNIVAKASEIMVDLRNETHETVALGKLTGTQGLVLEVILSDEPVKFVVDVGHHFDLHCSAPGKILLAHLPQEKRDKLLDALEYHVYNERTIKSRCEMEEEIEQVVRRGYAIDFGEKILGIHCIAAPIFDYRKQNVASLWITGPSNRMEEARFGEFAAMVTKHALRISKKMGYDPDILENSGDDADDAHRDPLLEEPTIEQNSEQRAAANRA